jgi:hypothetical protein
MSELERTLGAIGAELQYPATPDIAPIVAERVRDRRPPARRPARRSLAIALALVLVGAGAAFAAAPSVRHTVLDWLGLRSVHIHRVPKLPALPPGPAGGDLGVGTRTTLAGARSHASFPLLVPRALPLGEIYVADAPVGKRVSLAYAPRRGLPRSPDTHVGVLITEFRGEQPAGFLQKTLGPGTTARNVTVNGDPAVWISGRPHEILYRTPGGQVNSDTLRLAGNTLIWRHGGVLVRIEADVPLATALRIARSTR